MSSLFTHGNKGDILLKKKTKNDGPVKKNYVTHEHGLGAGSGKQCKKAYKTTLKHMTLVVPT